MTASLRMTDPPAEPAVGLAVAKAHLLVDHAEDDPLILRLLAGACADAGMECGTGFGVASYLLTLDGFPGGWDVPWVVRPGGWYSVAPDSDRTSVRLGLRPVASVASVRYFDPAGTDTLLSPSAYWVGSETGRLAPAAGCWPATQAGRPESVRVAFTAGTAAVPPQGVDAVLFIVGDRYHNRGDGDARRAIPDAARRLLWQMHPGDAG